MNSFPHLYQGVQGTLMSVWHPLTIAICIFMQHLASAQTHLCHVKSNSLKTSQKKTPCMLVFDDWKFAAVYYG